MLINVAASNAFSVLPDELVEQSRQRFQDQQVLKVLVFPWQSTAFALPEVAVLRVIPLPTQYPETLINRRQLDWQGIPVQILTPARIEDVWASPIKAEPLKYVIIFRIPDGRSVGWLSATIPDSVGIQLSRFTPILAEPTMNIALPSSGQLPQPLGNWVKFQAQPNPDDDDPGSQLSDVIYLLDLERIQQS